MCLLYCNRSKNLCKTVRCTPYLGIRKNVWTFEGSTWTPVTTVSFLEDFGACPKWSESASRVCVWRMAGRRYSRRQYVPVFNGWHAVFKYGLAQVYICTRAYIWGELESTMGFLDVWIEFDLFLRTSHRMIRLYSVLYSRYPNHIQKQKRIYLHLPHASEASEARYLYPTLPPPP